MSMPPKNDAVIHFAYPNANGKAGDLGCGRFALLEGPQPGYSVAAPNASRLGRVKTAAKWLAPEAHDDSKILYEYKDFPRQNYTGNSLHLAYLLILINHARPLKFAIQGDIWCTGAIELLADKSPFLEEVFPEEFTLKVRAFLKPANPDQLFILPAANVQPVHEDLFQKQGVRVLSVSNFETLSLQELSEGKTILKVHGDELEQLVALLFTAAPAKALRPGQNPYRGLFAFREEDAEFFCGREKYIEQIVVDLQHKPFLALIGASGSGKTSLVCAGVLPKLRQQGNWRISSLRPGDL